MNAAFMCKIVKYVLTTVKREEKKKELNFWSISELFQFLPLPAEYRETSGSCSGHLCESTFSFSCIRLVRTCTEASFEKPGKMQSVPLHFQVTVHTVKNFSKLG